MFIRLKKGPLPMRIHFSDSHLVVMQGVIKQWSADQSESDVKVLAHGSYWFQPANEPHAENGLSDECLLHLVWVWKVELPARNGRSRDVHSEPFPDSERFEDKQHRR